jgi:RNA polymerase sigma-B factor
MSAARTRTDRALFARHAAGDPRARNELIEQFLPLAHSVARRYKRRGEPLDDLLQVASVALVNAVDRFEPGRGHAFTSFAVPTIVGELKRHFRNTGWSVRPPRSLQELTLQVEAAAGRLSQRLNRAPTVAELVAETGATEEQVLQTLHASTARDARSLQAPVRDDATNQQTLGDTLGIEDDGYAKAEDRAALGALLAYLSPNERLIVRLCFERDLTQVQVGELLGLSQIKVSRIVRRAITLLHHISEQQQALVQACSG